MTHTGASPLEISVVMATYNGCPYLDAQLESIAVQTHPPDEIVIGDDCSTDATEAVVAGFARRHPGIPVRFERNRERLGTTRNFEQAVERCRGDVVVFADQDDLWMTTRLARMIEAFTANPDAAYVFCDGILIDTTGRTLPGSLFASVDFTAEEQERYRNGRALEVLLRHNVVTGAALAVRRGYLERALPFESAWLHDYFLAFMLEVLGRGVILEQPLIKYRRHGAQQVGVAGRGGLGPLLAYARKQNQAYCRQEAINFRQLRSRLIALGVLPEHRVLAAIEEKSRFIDLRARMRAEPRRAPGLLWQAWRRHDYARYSLGWKQAVVDILAAALIYLPPRGAEGPAGNR